MQNFDPSQDSLASKATELAFKTLTQQKSPETTKLETMESYLDLFQGFTNPENFKEFVNAINNEVMFFSTDNKECFDRMVNTIKAVFEVIKVDQFIEPKDRYLYTIDNLIKLEREVNFTTISPEFFKKCFRDESNKSLKLGLIKLLFFMDELKTNVQNFRLLLILPMIPYNLTAKKFGQAGQNIGDVIKTASVSTVSVKDEKLGQLDMFNCVREMGKSMFMVNGDSKVVTLDDKGQPKFDFVQALKNLSSAIESSKQRCIIDKLKVDDAGETAQNP